MDNDELPTHITPPAPKSATADGEEHWRKAGSAKRILELEEAEANIANLLQFAGYTLASLHPEPMSNFTSRKVSLEGAENSMIDDDDDEEEGSPMGEKRAEADGENRQEQFAKYAEAYYTTLNDVQLALRTSIRHLRLSRASPAPLLDPSFGSLATAESTGIGVGGVALDKFLRPLGAGPELDPRKTATAEDSKLAIPPKSVAALTLERDAWADLLEVLEKSRVTT